MKATTDKAGKRRKPDEVRTLKPCCGTLSYIAECRGIVKKPGTSKWQAQFDGPGRLVRKYSASPVIL